MTAARAVGLLLGAAADGVIGSPGRRRPVARLAASARRSGAGPACVTGLAAGLVVAGVLAERAGRRGPVLQALGTATATWAVLGGAGLAANGASLARDLEEGRLDEARETLGGLDPRRTGKLDVIGLSRASVETVAQRTADDMVAPLVWGALAGMPGLLAARVLSLLRPAAGQRGPLTWLVARLDELIHLVPTRVAAALTVVAAPVVGGSAKGSWRAWRRDSPAHPGPNAGRAEAAFAGALEIRLGGRTVYRHGVADLPVLGDGRNPDAGHVTRAVELSRVVGWLAAAGAAVLAVLTGLRRR
ncbi:cobalamin biosynthesis protein [Amycolatopsis rhizosphaerae]|uniref:Cobalamin biosynthesis protein CobD n=1 Tax=Amycolatopsis rhizosphaerae TaxID=2053003 RepID=A0A558D435_9PSEU|nr:cobalamin biosynthesis protein [Amycolatopsis rhizosphaerae]TVT55777.1 cobalamin biosynthesis protein [Amycolatopsis rhizosphaerae]